MAFDLLFLGGVDWNIPFFVGLVCFAGLYVFLLKRHTVLKLYHKQPLLFFLGLIIIYAAIGSPFAMISHLSFSLHMLQMSILYFIIPPIFMLGIPEQLIQKLSVLNRLFHLIPASLALAAFGVLFFIYHLPFTLQNIAQFPLMQHIYHMLLLLLAISMWIPIVSPDPSKRFYQRKLKRYVLCSGLLIMPACLLFIAYGLFLGMDNPFLAPLTDQLCIPNPTSSLRLINTTYDQLMAGFLMLFIHKAAIALSFKLGH